MGRGSNSGGASGWEKGKREIYKHMKKGWRNRDIIEGESVAHGARRSREYMIWYASLDGVNRYQFGTWIFLFVG